MQVLHSYHSATASIGYVAPRPAETGLTAAEETPVTRGAITTSPEAAEARATTMKYHRAERTTLFLETQEGDTVQLKFKSRDSLHYEATSAEAGETAGTEIELRTRSKTKLSVQVHGHLNDAEVAAIQEAIERASELADDFFTDGTDMAFSSADALGIDGEQLVAAKIRMRVDEKLTYSSVGFSVDPDGEPAELPPVPVAIPTESSDALEGVSAPIDTAVGMDDVPAVAAESEVPVEGSEAPMPVAVDGAVAVDAGEESAPDPLQDPASLLPLMPAQAFLAIHRFLDRLVETFFEPADENPMNPLDVSTRLRIFERTMVAAAPQPEASGMESEPEGDVEAKAEVPQLLHDAVDSLASTEAPVDKLA